MDGGEIIAQGAIPVRDDDTEDTLAARVLAVEHRIYPIALRLLAQGKLRLENGRCRIEGTASVDTMLLVPDV
jgi:phosphoribosylglycinamide formyltransferase-1